MSDNPNCSAEIVIDFIRRYRYLETSIYEEGFRLVASITGGEESITQHLCNQWRWKKKNFGGFFLNLGTQYQIRILHQWGIIDPYDKAYLAVEDEDPQKYLFLPAPSTVSCYTSLLLFFENHGIESFPPSAPYPGLSLSQIPPAVNKRFGNCANWGDYFLTLDDAQNVLDQIELFNSVERRSSSF